MSWKLRNQEMDNNDKTKTGNFITFCHSVDFFLSLFIGYQMNDLSVCAKKFENISKNIRNGAN